MSLTNIEPTIILDLYDHDTTPSTIKAIQLDSNTRYVAAVIRNRGEIYDIGANATVTLTVIRPDRTGVQITGSPRAQSEFTPGGEEVVTYGAYAELSQAALAVKGTLRAQFMFTSGDQILRTEIFAINCGEALDASTDTWAGEYQGYNLDELVQNVNSAVATVEGMEQDVSELKSGFSGLNNGRLIFNPSYILTDVIYATDGTIRPLSGCICYVYELEQMPYHIEVANRDNVAYGLSNTLYSGTLIVASVRVNESVTEYDFDNNLNYKYLYITKKGQSSEYGINLYTNFKDKILGNEMRVIDVADEHVGILANNLSSHSQGYIISTTGEYYQRPSVDFYATDYLDVEGLNNLILLMPVLTSLSTHAGAAFYDSEKTYISGVECSLGSVGGNETRIVDIPSNAKYIRTTCRGSAWSDFFVKQDDIYINTLNIKKIKDKASTFGVQMFAKIGVIGDSISCGWAKDKNGNNSRRNLSISWPQQLARRCGCTVYNLGASGVDPVEWFQPNYEFAQYCHTQYQSVGFCDLYIIGLGLNPTSTLGSISDINSSDYTQNAETFFGQYARIIQMINAEHPDAIVICVTEPTTRIASTDQAVRDICALSYINANLVDLEKDYFDLFNTEEIISERQPDGLHYTPYGYSLLANAMETALNDYIAKHTTNFKYVGVASV